MKHTPLKTTLAAIMLIICIGTKAQQQAPVSQQMKIYDTPFAPDSFKILNRAFLSIYMGGGLGYANYDGLHQLGVYPALPANLGQQFMCEITAGKPNGFYFSWIMKGSLDKLSSEESATAGYTGFTVGHTIYENPYRHFFGLIAPETGLAYGSVDYTGSSENPGQTISNAIVLNTGVTINLLSWYGKLNHMEGETGNAISSGRYVIALKLGYAYQLGDSWHCPHVVPDAPINMSGFYASLGFGVETRNKWYPKKS